MAGANNHQSNSFNRNSRWESKSSATKHTPNSNLNPNPKPSPNLNNTSFNKNKKTPPANHQPDPYLYPNPSQLAPPPQPTYGFHMLLRSTIVLADGTGRSYFALPLEYEEFSGRRLSPLDNVHVDGGLKRKFGDEERVGMRNADDGEYMKQRQQLMQYGNVNSTRNLDHLGDVSERNDGISIKDSEEPRSSKYL